MLREENKGSCYVIFATKLNLQTLRSADTVLVDRTFKSCPKPFQSINQFIKSERTKRPFTSQYKIHDIEYINTHKHIMIMSNVKNY